MLYALCCGQLWVRHMICGQTCDGLYHFAFSLIVLGLYSEIDHIHLSSEAQCVSHLYPQVDCHTLHSSFGMTMTQDFWDLFM